MAYQSGSESEELMSLIYVFDSLPSLSTVDFARIIPGIEPIAGDVTIRMDVQDEDDQHGSVLHAIVGFGDHEVQMAGFSYPTPADVLEHTVRVSNWSQASKPPLMSHKAHIMAFYRGTNTDPVEQLLALHKIGFCFQSAGLLGFLDIDGWNSMPADFVPKLLEPEMIKSCRKQIPLGIWGVGFVKMMKDADSVWFCTKGSHRFGVHDLAYLGRLADGDFAFDTFTSLFGYMRSGAVLKPGHTAQVGEDDYLRFREPYEYADWLESPGGTLVIEKSSGAEINRR